MYRWWDVAGPPGNRPHRSSSKARTIQAHTDEIASGSTLTEIEDRHVLVRSILTRQIILGYEICTQCIHAFADV